MNIGVIGLGLVGNAVAGRLAAAGYVVYGYDLVPEACKKAGELGVRIQTNAAEVAAAATTLVLCLMTSEDRRTLLWGAQALAVSLQPDSVLLDVSTSRPEDMLKDAERLSVQRVHLVDVCLSGSSEVIARGEALALVGDAEVGANYRKILSHFTKTQFFLGRPGDGNRMKLIVNLVFGLNRLVLAEALGLAAKAGYDLNTVLEILKAGETYSVCMDTKGPKMTAGKYEPPVAKLAQHAKDVMLILEMARAVGARAPVSELHAQLLQELLEAGAGNFDNAAIFKAYT